jgi:hypothetical protein
MRHAAGEWTMTPHEGNDPDRVSGRPRIIMGTGLEILTRGPVVTEIRSAATAVDD